MSIAFENFFIVNTNFLRSIGIVQENLEQNMGKFSKPLKGKSLAHNLESKNPYNNPLIGQIS